MQGGATLTGCSRATGSLRNETTCCRYCTKGKPCGDSCIAEMRRATRGKAEPAQGRSRASVSFRIVTEQYLDFFLPRELCVLVFSTAPSTRSRCYAGQDVDSYMLAPLA